MTVEYVMDVAVLIPILIGSVFEVLLELFFLHARDLTRLYLWVDPEYVLVLGEGLLVDIEVGIHVRQLGVLSSLAEVLRVHHYAELRVGDLYAVLAVLVC